MLSSSSSDERKIPSKFRNSTKSWEIVYCLYKMFVRNLFAKSQWKCVAFSLEMPLNVWTDFDFPQIHKKENILSSSNASTLFLFVTSVQFVQRSNGFVSEKRSDLANSTWNRVHEQTKQNSMRTRMNLYINNLWFFSTSISKNTMVKKNERQVVNHFFLFVLHLFCSCSVAVCC